MKTIIRFFTLSLVVSFLLPAVSNAQICLRDTARKTTTTTTLTINKPAKLVQGDVMIASIAQGASLNAITAPSGWTLVDAQNLTGTGSTSRYGAVFYKIAGSSESSTYTFTLGSGSNSGAGTITAFSGVDTTGGVKADGTPGGPFDVDPGTILASGTSSTTVSATSITTSSSNAGIVMCGLSIGGNRTYSAWTTTSPGTLNETVEIGTGSGAQPATGTAWAILTAAGATGPGSATLSGGDRNGGILLALKPRQTTLWACLNNTQVAAFTSTYSNGPLSLFGASFTGTTTAANSIGALGRSTSPSQSLGNFYWITNSASNQGVIELYGSTGNAGTPTRLGSLDFNGASTSNLSYVSLAIDNTNTGYILAGDGTTLYLASFPTTTALSATTITMVDNDVTPTRTTASVFVYGDICINSSGKILALGNDGSGNTVVASCSPNGASTTLALVLTLKAPGGSNMTGDVNGIAYDPIGNVYVSASTGLYYIPSNYISGYNGTVNLSLVWSGTGLTDLASNYYPANAIIPVPVKLGEFSAKLQGGMTLLNWNTLTEINSDHFEIERSLDGVRFSKVGSVNAAGNSSDNLKYQYSDAVNGLSGMVYYRLRTVDIDSKSEYSKIVAVKLSGAAINQFSVFPNPCVDNMKISVNTAKETMATIRISNMAGQQVVSKNVLLQQRDNVIVLTNEIANLRSGIHTLELISADGVKTQKILKK